MHFDSRDGKAIGALWSAQLNTYNIRVIANEVKQPDEQQMSECELAISFQTVPHVDISL